MRLPTFLVLAVLLAGCLGPKGTGTSHDSAQAGASGGVGGPSLPADALRYVFRCDEFTVKEEYAFARNATAWQDLWVRCGQAGLAPALDFGLSTAIGYFWGPQKSTGYQVAALDTYFDDESGRRVLEVARIAPGRGCVVGHVFTYPGVLVVVGADAPPAPPTFLDAFSDCHQ
jgi:protease stability complex PrcB-like protein